ncbi:MAG: phosphoglucosamine mutase [Armatimonadetes bacterium]|nr:phosphoglucosamine mutase [Armatimonadota bacterium]
MRKPLALKIGISGVRGVVGQALTPQLISSFAAAFGSHIGRGRVLVGTDSRPSRDMVRHATISGLLSVGCQPVDLGILPVPALQLHIRTIGAFGGVCVTASHNPIEWNALKFFGADGILLRPAQAEELTDLYHQGVFPRIAGPDIPEVLFDDTAIESHLQSVLASVDADLIRSRRLHVAVDCCNGAASRATPQFLERLGCRVTAIHTDPDQPFPHNPEPIPANLGDLCRTVRDTGADVGFAQDADADRVAVVNERGEPIGEEAGLALAVLRRLEVEPSPVVVNMSTSRMVDDVAALHGCIVHRAKVGEVNVVEKMLAVGAPIGGEGNGGIISLRTNACRDSFVGMAILLEALAARGCSLSAFRSEVPTYSFLKEKITFPAREVATALRRFRERYSGQEMDLSDGVKVTWPDRWVQARSSNTEPIIRVLAEAPTDPEARQMVDEAFAALSG